jgi:hypothetical protein
MIKGKKLTATDKYLIQNFSEDYLCLIGLIDKMEIKLEIVKSKIKLISINNYSINSFEELLHTKFDETVISIKSDVYNQQSNASKISELDKYIIDYHLRYPFFSSKDLFLHHKQVLFVGKSKSNPETVADIQECYQTINFFSQRLNQFLEELHKTILLSDDNTSFLSDTPALVSYSATSDNPFAFYEFIFKSNGIAELINQFAPSEDDILTYGVEYDKQKLIKTYFERDESGEWITHEIRFINNLKQIVSKQLQVSKRCLKTKIELISDLTSVSDYLLHSLNSLIRMHENQLPGVESQYKAVCQESIQKMITYIDRHYQVYLRPKSNSIIKNFQQNIFNITNTTQIIDSGPRYHFTIKGIPKDKFLLQAWQLFIKECVHDKDYDLFLNVFEGSIKQEKLRKIKWQSKYNGKPFIKPLFYFFDKLRQLGVIDETETTLKTKVQIMFGDHQGKELLNIQQKFYQYKKDPGRHDKIEQILGSIAKR